MRLWGNSRLAGMTGGAYGFFVRVETWSMRLLGFASFPGGRHVVASQRAPEERL